MIIAILLILAALAIVCSGLALALLERDAGVEIEQRHGWPVDGS